MEDQRIGAGIMGTGIAQICAVAGLEVTLLDLTDEGLASAPDIDSAMRLGCKHPVGPLALADMIGLGTLLSILDTLDREFGDQKYRPAPLLRELVAAGRLGRKTKCGFYTYADVA
jgi:3-hydroxyacyl-CoA dehydrogenase